MTLAQLSDRFHIPRELLEEAGVRHASDLEVRELLRVHGRDGQDLAGILIPYTDPRNGGRTVGYRVRLDAPAEGMKYLSEQGCRHLFIAPVPTEWLADSSIPAVVVEAEKSALALLALAERYGRKLLPIATGGVWGWRRTVGNRPLPDGGAEAEKGPSPTLDWLTWTGRKVIIAFDSNVAGRADLLAAQNALAQELAARGAVVLIAEVPAGGGVNGPDDLIAVKGDDAALAILDGARALPNSAIAEAERLVAGIEASKRKDHSFEAVATAIKAIAEVDDELRQAAFVGRLADLKIPGIGKPEIKRRIAIVSAEAAKSRRAAAMADEEAEEEAKKKKLLVMEVDGAALMNDLVTWIPRFVVLSADQVTVCALWVVASYLLPCFDYFPILWLRSPEKRCAKSRLQEVLLAVALRPWRAHRTTPAAIYRKIEAEHPTLFLDELDKLRASNKELAAAVDGILNSCFERAGSVTVCEKTPSGITTKDFSTFAAVCLAGIGEISDTTADRSIPIAMKRKLRSEKVSRFRRREIEKEATAIRERLEAWAVQRSKECQDARPALPNELNDRQQDIIEPLLAVAGAIDGEWPERARTALVHLCAEDGEEAASVGTRLLGDIKTIFGVRCTDRIRSRELVEALREIETGPWASWSKGHPILPTQVARLLNPFGIHPHSVRFSNNEKAVDKGYLVEDFTEVWARYLPSDSSSTVGDSEVSSGHTVTPRASIGDPSLSRSVTNPPVTNAGNAKNGNVYPACNRVTPNSKEITVEGEV